MNNKLSDLNNALFEEIERLQDDDLKPEQLETEIKRAQAVTSVATAIIANADMALKAQRLSNEYGTKVVFDNPLLESHKA